MSAIHSCHYRLESASIQSRHQDQVLWKGLRRRTFKKAMTSKRRRAERREQQAREVEASQELLRESIAETDRLVDDADQMLKRHAKEREEDDRATETPV